MKLSLIQIIYSYMPSSIPIEYKQFSNRFIWPSDVTLKGTTISSKKELGSNDNEGIFHTDQSSKTGASLSDSNCGGGLTCLQDIQSAYSKPCQKFKIRIPYHAIKFIHEGSNKCFL